MRYNINNSSSRAITRHCPILGHYLLDLSHIISHDGGHYKAPKVYGSKSVSFSMQSSNGDRLEKKHNGQCYGSHAVSKDNDGWKNTGLFNINEKETMQHLNQRLSTYLAKVRFLEQENAKLERKICEWHDNNTPSRLPNSSQYFRTIQELQNQVSSSTMKNAQIHLHISNAKLASEDLRDKYEMECNLRSSVDADIAGLRRSLSQLNVQRQNLEIEVHCLQEELVQLKNIHEEEVNHLQSQLGCRVNVDLKAAPSVDLSQVLSKIREEYENLMERNLQEVENIFLNRSTQLNGEMSSGAEQIVSFKNEIVDLRHSVHTLEIELQSQLNLKSTLWGSLTEVENIYGSQLAQIQNMVDYIGKQISQIRSDVERRKYNYQQLMDQKSLLEMEIGDYNKLLDDHDIKVSSHHVSMNKDVLHRGLSHHGLSHYMPSEDRPGREASSRMNGLPIYAYTDLEFTPSFFKTGLSKL
ncbi:keratin, type I cytoskeletal 19-like [Dendropsophus ebraccatus]|uniref:keratin, type I cytoskeletal 19-like n=1 Tax=Dendropsophus ebraccatus TaxID=150705 RepID=UPI003831C8BC